MRILWMMVLAAVICSCSNTRRTTGRDEPIPFDPDCRYGQLKNGFTYYIKPDSVHGNQIVLRLVINAGHEQEEPDQLEYAHLLEHMAFKRTVHYANVKDSTKSWGAAFGNYMNGSTDFKFTDYSLTIQAGDSALLRKSLQLLRDWAQGGIVLDKTQIDSERSVVLQELNMRKRDSKEKAAVLSSMVLPAEYIGRASEDTRDVLMNGPAEALRRFYNDWYHPSLEAIIIEGAVTADALEKQVGAMFGDMTTPPGARMPKPSGEAVLDGRNRLAAKALQEQTDGEFSIRLNAPFKPEKTMGDYKAIANRELFAHIVKARFAEVVEQSGIFTEHLSIFWQKGKKGAIGSRICGWTVFAHTAADNLEKGVSITMAELHRLRKHGFTEKELQRAKDALIAEFKAEATSGYQRYEDHFTIGDAAPAPTYRQAQIIRLTQEATLEELQEMATGLDLEHNRDVIMLLPASHQAHVPDEATLAAWIKTSEKDAQQQFVYTEDLVPASLMSKADADKLPMLSKDRISMTVNGDIGLTVLELPNGIKVLVKQVKQPKENIGETQLYAVRDGGTDQYTDADFAAAYMSAPLVRQSRLGLAENMKLLNKYLNRENLRINPMLEKREAIIQGESKDKDGLEKMLQLVYLYFTAPSADSGRIKQMVKDSILQLEHLNARIDNPARKLTVEAIWNADPHRSYEIFRENFSHARDFVFVMTTDESPDFYVPLIGKYLGALPATRGPERRIANHYKPPVKTGFSRNTVYNNSASKDFSSFSLVFNSPVSYNVRNVLAVEMLGSVLMNIASSRFRDKEGFSYSPLGYSSISMYNGDVRVFLTLGGDCPTAKVNQAAKVALEELNQLKANGPAPGMLNAARKVVKDKWMKLVKESPGSETEFWKCYLLQKAKSGGDYNEILQVGQIIDSINGATIRDMAREYMKEEHGTLHITLPEVYRKESKKLD